MNYQGDPMQAPITDRCQVIVLPALALWSTACWAVNHASYKKSQYRTAWACNGRSGRVGSRVGSWPRFGLPTYLSSKI